jgi:hypothetical protein
LNSEVKKNVGAGFEGDLSRAEVWSKDLLTVGEVWASHYMYAYDMIEERKKTKHNKKTKCD